MHSYVHCSIIHGGQDMETIKLSLIEDWIKVWHIHTMDYYSAIRRDEILPFVTTWRDLENIMLSEISKTDKAKNFMISLICGI